MDSEKLRNQNGKDTPKAPAEKKQKGDKDDYVIDGPNGLSEDAIPGQG